MTATCRRCQRERAVRPRWRLCPSCYNRLWQRRELAIYAPPPLPPAAPLTSRLIPPSVRQQIRAQLAQGHTVGAVAQHYRISRHSVTNIRKEAV